MYDINIDMGGGVDVMMMIGSEATNYHYSHQYPYSYRY